MVGIAKSRWRLRHAAADRAGSRASAAVRDRRQMNGRLVLADTIAERCRRLRDHLRRQRARELIDRSTGKRVQFFE